MFNDFEAVNKIEGLLVKVLKHGGIGGEHLEASLRAGLPRDLDAGHCHVDSGYAESAFMQLGGYRAISATDIERSRVGRKMGG
jgi:hypothetical protein